MTLVSQAELDHIRHEVEWLPHLRHGFYLHRGEVYTVTVVAQGPFDWTRLQEVSEACEMVGGKMGIEIDFAVQLDPPTAEQKKNLFPTRAEEVMAEIKRLG